MSITKARDQQNEFNRKAKSPDLRNTYIGLWNIPLKSNLCKEQNEDIKIKRIKVYLKSRSPSRGRNIEVSSTRQTEIKEINSSKKRDEVLASLMK